jgi:DNA (cytosine-5)-methyltransferase 1
MKEESYKNHKLSVVAVDLFCGAGGMTHGFIKAGIPVIAGIDTDETCKYAYEKNNNTKFINKDIRAITGTELASLYPENGIRILTGCAPCQPFSTHTQKNRKRNEDDKWGLLYTFSRLIKEIEPDIVSMENVPQIEKQKVFSHFIGNLEKLEYHISWQFVYCPDYGIPQTRTRLVLLASRLGNIQLISKTHTPSQYRTVEKSIRNLEAIRDGETSSKDPLHKACKLTAINKNRIHQSKPGGTWRDWDKELLTPCHQKPSGKSYVSVYSRMEWDKPAPTITTQFYNFGTGRFGHPEQHRALSLREGALLQTFPKYYKFIDPKLPFSIKRLGRHIGNAVPVRLGEIIGISIMKHLEECNGG